MSDAPALWPGWSRTAGGHYTRPDGLTQACPPPVYPGPGAGMRLIVCGGRDYAAAPTVEFWLSNLHWRPGKAITTLVHGACPTGADKLAEEWALKMGVPVEQYPADWERYGPAAGPRRNAEMAALGADGVVAFPGGAGTLSMCREAKARGIPVWWPAGTMAAQPMRPPPAWRG